MAASEHCEPAERGVVIHVVHVEDGLDHVTDVELSMGNDAIDGRIARRRQVWRLSNAMPIGKGAFKITGPSKSGWCAVGVKRVWNIDIDSSVAAAAAAATTLRNCPLPEESTGPRGVGIADRGSPRV